MLTDNLSITPEREEQIMSIIEKYGQIDGDHHKAWVIDQIARIIKGDDYGTWVEEMKADGEYNYNEGIAP
jgi:hypothetical protein